MQSEHLEKIGVRKIDDLGRIVIPKEIRRILEINEGDALEFLLNSNKIIIRQYMDVCTFCTSCDDLVEFKGKLICKGCINKLSSLPNDLI